MDTPDSRLKLLLSGTIEGYTLYRTSFNDHQFLRSFYYHNLAWINTSNLVDDHEQRIEEMAKLGARREIKVTTENGHVLPEFGGGILLRDNVVTFRDFLNLGHLVWDGQQTDTIIKYNESRYLDNEVYNKAKLIESGYKFKL